MDIVHTARDTVSRSAIEVRGLSLERGGKMLFRDMSWSLDAGSFLAVTGPSGTGKSSLMACLRGHIMPTSGQFTMAGNGSASVGTVFQHLRLTDELSVLTNVLCGRLGNYPWWRTLAGFGAEDKAKAFRIISELGLSELVHKPVRNISGGEQQRTAIARVLLQDPDIILADEPTSDLDMKLATKVVGRFRQLCVEMKRTVVSVMHDEDLVERFADLELRIGPVHENGWTIREIKRS